MCVQPPGMPVIITHSIIIYVCCILPECGDPGILLQGSVSLFVTENGSTIVTYSCDPGYSLNGSTTSLCVLGEWTPSPETVTCIAEKDNVTSVPGEMGEGWYFKYTNFSMSTGPMDAGGNCHSASCSLSTSDVVAITAVVTGLCSVMTGLLLGVLLTRCIHCRRKTDQTQRPPVYKDIPADRKTGIELKHNEAYGHIQI